MDPNIGYRIPLAMAIVLHVLVIGFLFVNLSLSPHRPQPQLIATEPVKIVEAVTKNQQQIEQEIARLKQQEKQKQQAEQARVDMLKAEANAAEQKRKQQEAKQKQAEAKRKQEEAKQKAEQKKLAELKSKQEAEQKRIADLQEKAEATKQQQAQEQKHLAELEKQRKEAQAQAEKEALEREAQRLLEQQLAEEQAMFEAAKKKQLQSKIDKYTALITHAVGQHWILPDTVQDEISCVLLIRLAPGGSVLNVQLVRSSGDDVLDRSAQSAVYKASPLPVPDEPELFETFREIRLLVKPEGYLAS